MAIKLLKIRLLWHILTFIIGYTVCVVVAAKENDLQTGTNYKVYNININLNGATEVDAIRSNVVRLVSESWQIINDPNTNGNVKFTTMINSMQKVSAVMLNQDYSIDEFYMLNRLAEWVLLNRDLNMIQDLFGIFRKTFMTNTEDDNNVKHASIDFAETVLNDRRWKIPIIYKKIDNTVNNQGLYYNSMLESKDEVCITRQSAQQVLYQLYNVVAITELKAYTMMQFSWMILKNYGKGNFSKEAEIARNRYEERIARTQKTLKMVMERADKVVWRCDPTSNVFAETYDSFTRLLQGFIVNEVDLNNESTCRENCAYYEHAESYSCFKDLYCSKQPKCAGKILNCQFIDSDMMICPSAPSSNRRYEFIKYENGRHLGQEASCNRGSTKVDSWWRWLFWHCSYCFCSCDEQGIKSDRFVNLREVVTNTSANKVIIGLRFTKVNRVFHLQVKEGELIARGLINETSADWKPVENYKITDAGIRNGVDYHTMAWNKRAIDLDDLIAPVNHVLTGIRFRTVGSHLNFEIRVTEIDFKSGKLLEAETASVWLSNDNTEASSRTEVLMEKPDMPTRSTSGSIPMSKTNQFIKFTHTDLDKDAAQTTIPFIDTQEVTSNVPVPLTGAGIFYKGRRKFGGYIAPKIFTYDMSSYIDEIAVGSQ